MPAAKKGRQLSRRMACQVVRNVRVTPNDVKVPRGDVALVVVLFGELALVVVLFGDVALVVVLVGELE